jgi:hypothetical protein
MQVAGKIDPLSHEQGFRSAGRRVILTSHI